MKQKELKEFTATAWNMRGDWATLTMEAETKKIATVVAKRWHSLLKDRFMIPVSCKLSIEETYNINE